MENKKYLIGIDEVGRGPLAGPVAIGFCMIPMDFYSELKDIFDGVKDSKKLTEKKREEWLAKIDKEKEKKNLVYTVSYVGNKEIDDIGISWAIKKAIKKSFLKFNIKSSDECLVLLDGGLKAPEEYLYQETIIKGDEKEPIISLASIIAKVARDKEMCLLAEKFPQYGFEKHKGYGTKEHIENIKKHGLCEIHRKTFCGKLYVVDRKI